MGSVAPYGGWQAMGQAQPATSALAVPTWGDGAGFEAISNALAVEDLIPIEIPRNCNVESIEVHMNTIAGGPLQITLVVFRDAAGDSVFLSDQLAAATQSIRFGLTTATQGGAVWKVDKDHRVPVFAGAAISTVTASSASAGTETATIHIGLRLDIAGSTARVDRVVVNWRA